MHSYLNLFMLFSSVFIFFHSLHNHWTWHDKVKRNANMSWRGRNEKNKQKITSEYCGEILSSFCAIQMKSWRLCSRSKKKPLCFKISKKLWKRLTVLKPNSQTFSDEAAITVSYLVDHLVLISLEDRVYLQWTCPEHNLSHQHAPQIFDVVLKNHKHFNFDCVRKEQNTL